MNEIEYLNHLECGNKIEAAIEKCDNFIAASELQMPAHIHAEALTCGMKDVREMLEKIHGTYFQ